MDQFAEFWIFIGKTIYTMIPPMVANIAPFLFKKARFLNYPMDFNLHFMGERLLGSNKTIRGLVLGVAFSMIFINIQYLIFKLSGWQLTMFDFNQVNFQLLGFLMGFGAIIGDAFKSLIKRRLHIPPGGIFIPWDQIDCAVGGLLFGRIVWAFPWTYAVATVVIAFVLHIIIRLIGYLLKLSDTRW